MSSYSDLKPLFDSQGYVVVPGFLLGAELTKLRDNLNWYIEQIVPSLSDADAFYEDKKRPETLKQMQRIERHKLFAEYVKHPLWRSAAQSLLGHSDIIAMGIEWFNKPPGTTHVTPPHQDNYYFCLKPPSVLTMWLALDPVDEENGCIRYVPGSHLSGVRPHGRTKTLGFSQGITDFGEHDLAREIPVHALPGDLLVHQGNTIHRALANVSTSRHRRSFAMVFKAASCVRDEDAYERYLNASKAQHMDLGLAV